jgi:alkylation response protein AidB-like acyl-CoA dehydrogenase
MDFEFTAEQQAFREELRQFLRKELPEHFDGRYDDNEENFQTTLRVTERMAEHGWLTMHWPREYGGRDAPIWEQVILREEMRIRNEPRGQQYQAGNFIGPSIVRYGTAEQKREHLLRIAAGRGLYCQGFSEPDSGSDLASLKTRADRQGDSYVINGEKIWTSHAAHAEYIYLAARTNQAVPKHKGISLLLVPMNTPGITVEPIRSMLGLGEFNHVVFDNVVVPVGCRLGEEDGGWNIIVGSLNLERIGVPRFIQSHLRLDMLAAYARVAERDGKPLYDNPVIRQRLAQLKIEATAAQLMYYWAVSESDKGNDITLLSSAARVHGTLSTQKISALSMELMGDYGDVGKEEEWAPLNGEMPDQWKESLVATIGAGTIEIQKNVIATRGLGLPR